MEEAWILVRTAYEGGEGKFYYVKHKYEDNQWISVGNEVEKANMPEGETRYSGKETATRELGISTDYGLESLSKKDFFEDDGITPKQMSEIVPLILKHKPYDVNNPEHGDDIAQYITDIRAKVEDMMPKLQEMDETEKGFLETEYGIAGQEGKIPTTIGGGGGISGTERALALRKSTDIYGLEGSAMGERERAYGAAGDVYGAAESAYGAAGDVYGAAKEAFTLGKSGSVRARETALDPLRDQAGAAAAQMQQAYGSGMGASMRGAIAGQKKVATGAERVYDAYRDEQTALSGAFGRAGSAYGRAGETYIDPITGEVKKGTLGRADTAYDRAKGAYTAEGTRIEQQRGYAEEQYGVGGIDERRADVARDKGLLLLEQEQEGGFESDIGTWLANFKQGGRVPSRQTFLDVLSRIPDAGGN